MSGFTEAPYSCNFRMSRDGEQFQFTVRDSDDAQLIDNIMALVAGLQDAGWQFAMTPQRQPVVPTSGQAPPTVPTAVPGLKYDPVDGWVLGTYKDKRTQTVRTCVWLYTERRPYRAHTIYPEQFGLLPFHVALDVAEAWQGSAPSREQAVERNVWRSASFPLAVVPKLGLDGQPEMKNGYVVYRPARAEELPASALPVAPAEQGDVSGEEIRFDEVAPPAPAAKKRQPPKPPVFEPDFDAIEGVAPRKQWGSDDGAMGWGMQDGVDFGKMAVCETLEPQLVDWLVSFRERIIAPLAVKGKPCTAQQWELLEQYAYSALIDEEGAPLPDDPIIITTADGLECSPAGLLTGLVSDRWLTSREGVSGHVAVQLLQLTQKMRGDERNQMYNEAIDHHLRRVLRTTSHDHSVQ